MFLWILSFLFLANVSMASIGKISKIVGESAHIRQGKEKLFIKVGQELKAGDEIFSDKSTVQINFLSNTSLILSSGTQLRVKKVVVNEVNKKKTTLLSLTFMKGILRFKSEKEQTEIHAIIGADGVTFSSKEADFEVSRTGLNYDLNVQKGEVTVSSPYVQTFVPEIVKAKEGFRFDRKAPSFQRTKFRLAGEAIVK